MAGIYCTIFNKKFPIEYSSRGLNAQGFKCPNVFIDKNGVYCDEIGFRKCPVYNLLEQVEKIDSKVLDELVKN